MDTSECYRLLEIDPTDSLKEVKQAYRDIVFVWHPDRMVGNPRVQEKAENKLKQINAAYEELQSYLAHEVSRLVRIAIYPQQVTLNFGERYTFSAVGFDQNGAEVELEHVTWSVSGGGTIYGEGSFFADYGNGSFTVVATSEGSSSTATILIKQPDSKVTETSSEDRRSDTRYEEKHFESEESEPKEPTPDVGFPWKRLLVWGCLTPAFLMPSSQDPELGLFNMLGALLFIMWIVGMIKPKAVFKFGLPNTRSSVTQIYLCLSMFLGLMTSDGGTVWGNFAIWFFLLWFIGMINPKATINMSLDNRGEVTILYICLGLVLGGIWGGFKGLSFLFGGM